MVQKWLKQLLCLASALLLAFSFAFAAEEEINLSPLSDDQLLALMQRVNQEIVARGIQKTATIPKGAYIAGRDLPVGTYVFTCLAAGDDWGNVTVYSEEGNGEQLLWEIVAAPEEGEAPETFLVRLSEGDRLKSAVPFSLTVFNGILFK